jgi:uncharacterized membrane protein
MAIGIEIDVRALTQTKWWEYVLRFLFGGAVTVITGLLAHHYGPEVGGLFLAFPAIFPASATLIEKHERKRKKMAGIPNTIRGRLAAALDARGVAMGSIGLSGFAVTAWLLLPSWNSVATLVLALAVWIGGSVLIWRIAR